MKILMLAEYFYPFAHGGSEWSIYHLAQLLIKKGSAVHILTPNYGAKVEEIWHKISIIRFFSPIKISKKNPSPITPFWHTNILWWTLSSIALVRVLRKKEIDIIHVQGKYFLPSALFAKLIFRKPVIATMRDYQVLCPYGFCLKEKRKFKAHNIFYFWKKELLEYREKYLFNKSTLFNLIYPLFALHSFFVQKLLAFLLQRTDEILCISKKMQRIFAANGFQSSVIYNSMHFANVEKERKKENIVLFVGRLTHGKGADIFVNAALRICKTNKKANFILIGKGYLGTTLKQLLRKTQYQSRFKFIKHLSYQKLLKFMEKSRLVVTPSVWEEPFGRVALESLSVGTPVIVTSRGGLPEIIDHGITGFVVEPNVNSVTDGIIRALQNEKKLQSAIIQNRDKLIKRFSDDVYNLHIAMYKKLHNTI